MITNLRKCTIRQVKLMINYAVGVYDSRKIIFSNDEYGDIIVTCTNTVGNGTRYEVDVPYSLFVEDIEGNAVFS